MVARIEPLDIYDANVTVRSSQGSVALSGKAVANAKKSQARSGPTKWCGDAESA